MMRAFYGIAVGSLLFLAGSIVVSAQGQGAGTAPQPNGFTNLQVWPADTPRAVVLNFMNAFDRSLGVECIYCHVQNNGRFDFASDEKREKRVARKMILFRDSINVELAAIVDKPVTAGPTSVEARPGAPTRVLCASCHHGLPVPVPLGEVISEAEKNGGVNAGLTGWVLSHNGNYSIAFTTSDKKTLIVGELIDDKGNNLTDLYAEKYFPKSHGTTDPEVLRRKVRVR